MIPSGSVAGGGVCGAGETSSSGPSGNRAARRVRAGRSKGGIDRWGRRARGRWSDLDCTDAVYGPVIPEFVQLSDLYITNISGKYSPYPK